jgi:glycosyltransferase involved in cell wall biosynthesis
MTPTFTILTCTYNRPEMLARVFASVQAQGRRDVEWLVVDDGSDDACSVAAALAACVRAADFPVRGVRQSNGHKKAAVNRGVREAQGELLIVLDDDDELAPDALQRLHQAWLSIPAPQRDRYVGVTGLCARPDGRIVGDRYPRDELDCTATDIHFKWGVAGEKFGCQRIDVLRRFPYPEDVAGFVPESLVWWAIARAGYLNRFVNQVFRIYHPTAVSLSTRRAADQPHAAGLYLLNWQVLQFEWRYARYAPLRFAAAALRLTRYRVALQQRGARAVLQTYPLTHPAGRLLVALLAPLGRLLVWCNRAARP